MTQQDIRELAKQSNPKALATLINQSLKPKNITAKVGVKNDCIQILLESEQVPNQEVMVSFIRKRLVELEVSLNTVKVYARKLGEENPAWNQTFELIPIQDTPIIPKPIDEPFSPDTPSLNDMESSVFSISKARQSQPQNISNPAQPQNISPRQSSEPLSVGNVVSAALRIYRDKFKLYWQLAFIGYLWVLVPIYGWAKFSAISALISRLAYSEVIERPETVAEARRHVMPKMWSFLGAGLLVGLIVTLVSFGAIFVFGFLGGILAAILGQNITTIIVLILLGIVASIAFFIGYIRLLSRLFIVEMPLAMEDNLTATSTISRSLQLTKGFVGRLQWILMIATLISLPISLVIQIASFVLRAVLSALFSSESVIFGFLYFLLIVGLSLASGSLLIPFWQA
ncbi:MAG: phage holin family protein, partial [Coleofasciculaceae cyanobacterium]